MNIRHTARNALLVALTAAATLIIRIPTPATQGYINVGDAVVFVSALLFGARTGAMAGGMGSALADLIGGYTFWAPFTLVIKGIEGLIAGGVFGRLGRTLERLSGVAVAFLSVLLAGGWMVLGYFLVEMKLYGWGPASVSSLSNMVQAGASVALGLPVAVALWKAGIKDVYPSYREEEIVESPNRENLNGEKLGIPTSVADNLPTMVYNELSKLSVRKQEEFAEEYKRKAKSIGVAYTLWLLIGWHYIYLRKWGIQILFWLTGGGLFIWWLVDLFRIRGMIRDYNKDIAMDVLKSSKAISGG